MQKATELKPRSGLNLIITLSIFASSTFLLWFASHAEAWQIALAAILFSILMQPNYVLLHEGSHGNHHHLPWLNWLLTTLNGALFPVSFSFYRLTHGFHHENNRSKHECFEYYDPQHTLGRRVFRYLQWYSILFGTYWSFIPMVNLVAATLPWLLKLWPFSAIVTTERMFDRFNTSALRWITFETCLTIIFWVLLWHTLDLQLLPTLALYIAFAFNWSTRQYIAHAFSPIDKETGAYNLKLGKMAQTFLLNSNYHLVHHQHPEVPWHLLPAYADQTPTLDYWRQYLHLWSAPKPLPCQNGC